MFASVESFGVFFFFGFTLSALCLIYEDKLAAFEEKHFKRRNKKKQKPRGAAIPR